MATPLPLAGPTSGVPPSQRVPVLHFVTGLAWLAIAAAGTVLVAPTLAEGVLLSPRLIAVTHAWTLGFVTTSIIGALSQLAPVALGAPLRSERASWAGLAALDVGTTALVAGGWLSRPAWLGVGWCAILLAFAITTWNLLLPIARAPKMRHVARLVLVGFGCIGASLAISAARIGAALGWWTVDAWALLVAHVHVAALGFATFVALGVGARMLPMFLQSRRVPAWPRRVAPWPIGAGLALLLAGALVQRPLLGRAGGAVIAAGIACYLVGTWHEVRSRAKAVLDPAQRQLAQAHIALAIALVLGTAIIALPSVPARVVAAYGTAAIVGWLGLLTLGVYHKVLPFLAWMHRFGARAGARGTPTVGMLTRPLLGAVTAHGSGAGALLLVIGIAIGNGAVARGGAALLAAACAAAIANFAHALAAPFPPHGDGATRPLPVARPLA
jgi:hypothetical protein